MFCRNGKGDHLHTGAHAVSVFFGQRKISVWDRVEESPQEALSLLNSEQGDFTQVCNFIFRGSFLYFYFIKKLLHNYFGYYNLVLFFSCRIIPTPQPRRQAKSGEVQHKIRLWRHEKRTIGCVPSTKMVQNEERVNPAQPTCRGIPSTKSTPR